jgi:hypothetical protein
MRYVCRPGGRWGASEQQLVRSGRRTGGQLRRAIGMTPRHARRKEARWAGPFQANVASGRLKKMELGRTEQWAGFDFVHNAFPII